MSSVSNYICDSYEDAGIVCQGLCTLDAATELAMNIIFNISAQQLQRCTLSVRMVLYSLRVEDH